MAVTFIAGYLKDCLMKKLMLLKRYSIIPNLNYYGTKTRVEFNGSCLKQDSVTFNYGKVVNIYIIYETSKSINISDYLTLKNCLFGEVSGTKNTDINDHKYFGYGIGFDRNGRSFGSILSFSV